jgi:hypothetical protein
MSTTYTCPSCGQWLWINNSAATPITCPMCLKIVPGPGADKAPVVERRDVLPVEEEAKRDTIDVGHLLAILCVSLLVGGIFALTVAGDVLRGLLLIIAALLIAGVIFAKTRPKYAPQVEVEPPARPDGQVVLDYAHHRKRQALDVEDSFRIGAFMSGFFIAIGVPALGFSALLHSKGNDEGIFVATGLAMVLVACAGYQLGRYPQFNGIGRGVAVGLVLAMMALIPFGACFVILSMKM